MPRATEIDYVVVLAIVDAVLVGLFFLLRVLPWSRPGPWRLIWLLATLTATLFVSGELFALLARGTAVDPEHQLPLFGAILAVSTVFILVYLHGQREAALAHVDALTGLGNARSVSERLRRVGEAGRASAVVYLDLDALKQTNDREGHDAGDGLLRAAARALRAAAPADALTARIGGDEFVIVLDGPAADAVEHVANALRVALRSAGVRASIGTARGPDGTFPSEVLRAADEAMYRAKAAGGDRLVVEARSRS